MADVPICVPPRYILYPVTPTLSVDAVQDKLIWEAEATTTDRPVGTEGGTMSVAEVTVTVVLAVTEPLLLEAVKV